MSGGGLETSLPTPEHVPVREAEISELRAFCAAAALGSIGEAARAMHVSQPAMSKRLKTLETVAGTELLVRSPRGVTLTPAGEQLYTAARQLLMNADTLNGLFRAPPPAPVARLACSPTAAEYRIPATLAMVAVQREGFAAEITTANSWVVRELVKDGRYELGVVAVDSYVPRSDELQERPLWRDEVIVAVPTGHAWEEFTEIPLERFVAEPMIERDPWAHCSRLVTVMLEQQSATRQPAKMQLGNTDAILEAALTLVTPALISVSSLQGWAAEGLTPRRVAGLRFAREFALVWSGPLLGLSEPAQAVADALRSEQPPS